MKDDAVFLRHIRDAVEEIRRFTADGRDAFIANRLVQAAVERDLEIVGEAAKRVSEATRTAHPEVPWREMAGMRDVLIHGYHRVDLDAVWNTVERSLPPLLAVLDELLAESE